LLAFTTESLNQGQPVELGQHDIDDGSVIRNRLRHLVAAFTIGAMVDGLAAFFQSINHESGYLPIILDHENAHNGGS
jgi:hypothetical protein